MKYKAFLFDLNGTMVDDMHYHIKAWYRILRDLGADISFAQMKEECYGKNNELLERVFPGRFSEEEKNKISIDKEMEYQVEFRPHLQLIGGLQDFLKTAKASGIRMAIGSAAIMSNIDFVIDGLGIRHYFDAIISADNVRQSKPEPETFISCAKELGIDANDCLVFEDAPKGVESALNAGMDCVVLTTMHSSSEFMRYNNVVAFTDNYSKLSLLPTAALS